MYHKQAGFLGKNACGTGYDYDLYLHRGAGEHILIVYELFFLLCRAVLCLFVDPYIFLSTSVLPLYRI